ncbi:Kelch repeat-containing protein [Streptomyces sp. NPDC056817]|uniref:Kelch repeat-containing protein n=1 Tax=Streptomyces sp. NPDC056817 TaxID=3345950 RepID=UPI003679089B
MPEPVAGPRTPPRARARWRRLAVAVLAPLLALTPITAEAQGVWLTLPSMPTARGELAGAAAPCPKGQKGKCVYAIGGLNDSGTVLNTVEAYSQAVNAWATLPSMPTARSELAGAAAPCPKGQRNSCVYAVGGADQAANPLNTAEAYSPAVNAWATLPSMPTTRSDLAGAAAPCPKGLGLRGTCVYAIGGFDAAVGVNTVEAYSPAVNAWATLPSMPTARADLAAAAPCPKRQKETCVYAIGGVTAGLFGTVLDTVEVYDPATNTWATLPSMPTARFFLAAASAPCPEGQKGTCVYAIGGRDKSDNKVGTVEAYSPASNTWATLSSLPTARADLAAASAPCPKGRRNTCAYAIGGRNPSNNTVGTTEAFAIERGEPRHRGHGHGHRTEHH